MERGEAKIYYKPTTILAARHPGTFPPPPQDPRCDELSSHGEEINIVGPRPAGQPLRPSTTAPPGMPSYYLPSRESGRSC